MTLIGFRLKKRACRVMRQALVASWETPESCALGDFSKSRTGVSDGTGCGNKADNGGAGGSGCVCGCRPEARIGAGEGQRISAGHARCTEAEGLRQGDTRGGNSIFLVFSHE